MAPPSGRQQALYDSEADEEEGDDDAGLVAPFVDGRPDEQGHAAHSHQHAHDHHGQRVGERHHLPTATSSGLPANVRVALY